MNNLKQYDQEIKNLLTQTVEKIKEFSLSQVDNWRKIPYLACKADGRGGWSETYLRAIKGYWSLEASARNGCYTVYVDLENGNLVSSTNPNEEAWFFDILRLSMKLEELDTNQIIKDLQNQICSPIPEYYKAYTEEQIIKIQNERMEKYKVEPIYERLVKYEPKWSID